MRPFCHQIICLVPCLLLLSGCRQPKVSPAQHAATEALWQQCAVCHGTKEMQRGPILDGMPAWVVEAQLKKFAAGIRGQSPKNRGEHLMGQAIDKIPDEAALQRLAAYVATLPPRQHLLVVKGDLVAGERLYREKCASCHGPAAGGIRELRSPPLASLEDWYVADQLRKYASGRRGYHPDDVDGRVMSAAATGLSQTEIRHLAAWIARQRQ